MEYIIRDSFGNYPWKNAIFYTHKDFDRNTPKEWTYYACRWNNHCTIHKKDANEIVGNLRRLNRVAQFENLDWIVVPIMDKQNFDYRFLKLSKEERNRIGEFFILTKD